MRKPLVAGNWKMHGTLSQTKTLAEGIKKGAAEFTDVDILVLPTFVHIQTAQAALEGSNVMVGAQNAYLGNQGAFTGEVSAPMLKDLGCTHVLIGHSERRSILNESLELVAEKFKDAVEAGIRPILCVGETQAERERNETETVIRTQLDSVVEVAGIDAFRQAVIAYEPVWAIGTGLTATPEQAQAVHAFIRQHIGQNNVDLARAIRILYGGSMKPENADSLLAMTDIDGGLIGGASLKPDSFLAICQAAHKSNACHQMGLS